MARSAIADRYSFLLALRPRSLDTGMHTPALYSTEREYQRRRFSRRRCIMASVSVRQWLNRMGGAGRHAGRQVHRIKPHCRLRLELLESRCLPSTVTNLTDHDPGSLRDAIANTPAGGTVDFQAGLTGTITLTTGELAINKDLTIAGPGAGVITVSGNHASRVFNIAATFTVDI